MPETAPAGRFAAVLFDRDGTLVRDVPYNRELSRVEPMPGARAAVRQLRAHRVRVGVVTNQSGMARGLLSPRDVERINNRIDELIGPFDGWFVCPHGPDDGCACRKPEPGLILTAARELDVPVHRCAVIGDIGADMQAAAAAGARGVLVPTPRTRPEEVVAARWRAPDLRSAVALVLNEPSGGAQ